MARPEDGAKTRTSLRLRDCIEARVSMTTMADDKVAEGKLLRAIAKIMTTMADDKVAQVRFAP